MDLLLTRRERDRFAAWLEFQAASDEGVIKELEALRQEMMVKHFKVKAAAYRIVAKELRNVEEASLARRMTRII